uniref:ST6 N-acetylgalactosaminide alpha-2,6-sialyltransferase 4 n=1 Tax=Eptatretus burgeri TaxID=7764 RepID=A0A8C4R9G1_EPTBU
RYVHTRRCISVLQPIRMHCPACAVVFSSGHLLDAGGGQNIDQAGCVFRMNTAPTQGYEQDVGSCTHVRVMSHTSIPILIRTFVLNPVGTNVTYVVWGPVQQMRRNKGGLGEPVGVTYRALKGLVGRHPGLSVYTLTEQEMKESDRIFLLETGKDRLKSGSYLSTGWFTLILALRIRNPTSKVPYHYYEPAGDTECATYRLHEVASRGAHRFITEKAVFGRWALLFIMLLGWMILNHFIHLDLPSTCEWELSVKNKLFNYQNFVRISALKPSLDQNLCAPTGK